ncbi:helix-turn-helix domain-containing protein [Streptomyces sp. SA3_actF]|uniref:helix-turn-helix domain-containing protein n=1 Tax=Streptomyces sp. SA3_actF TaxID=682181 RepID=UPI001F20525D|nr:helix-turn-helix domain-containing protein [Streptomyces sp. SA3_actF]
MFLDTNNFGRWYSPPGRPGDGRPDHRAHLNLPRRTPCCGGRRHRSRDTRRGTRLPGPVGPRRSRPRGPRRAGRRRRPAAGAQGGLRRPRVRAAAPARPRLRGARTRGHPFLRTAVHGHRPHGAVRAARARRGAARGARRLRERAGRARRAARRARPRVPVGLPGDARPDGRGRGRGGAPARRPARRARRHLAVHPRGGRDLLPRPARSGPGTRPVRRRAPRRLRGGRARRDAARRAHRRRRAPLRARAPGAPRGTRRAGRQRRRRGGPAPRRRRGAAAPRGPPAPRPGRHRSRLHRAEGTGLGRGAPGGGGTRAPARPARLGLRRGRARAGDRAAVRHVGRRASLGPRPRPLVLADPLTADNLSARHLSALDGAGRSSDEIERTTRVYLECDQDVREVARRLAVHPNTVRYRVSRFQELTDLNLRRTEDLVTSWWLLNRRRA